MKREERLQKIIAAAGVASRRKAEQLIVEGRVTVNGKVTTRLGTKADPDADHIKVDGKLVRMPANRVYILLNKPRKVICTMNDPQGRTRVTDLVQVRERIYPVGRLDFHTEGLILLTNDGEFGRIVGSAGRHMPKVYDVKVRSRLDEAGERRLKDGLRLPDGTRLAPCRVEPVREGHNSWYRVTLTQGKNQQIRRMFQAVGHPVMKLRRIRIGFLTDKGLAPGDYRTLSAREVARILRLGAKGKEGKVVHRDH